jgi:shikimate dehydrogenase
MTAAVPLAGVIGRPVAHSLSPRLHRHWLDRMGLAGHYVPLDVVPADLQDILRALPRMGFVGANVTIPHKEAVLALADRVTERAQRIGAANTLVFASDGGVEADNTDAYGFIENLRSGAPAWRPEAGLACVIGAGGAARAVVRSLLEAGVPELRLVNRTRGRADALADEVGGAITVFDWTDLARATEGASTIANTTSLGMEGQQPVPADRLSFGTGAVATDLVYAPLRTPFLRAAEAAGASTVDGLGMLIWQAVPGFERWFGARPVVDDAVRAALVR